MRFCRVSCYFLLSLFPGWSDSFFDHSDHFVFVQVGFGPGNAPFVGDVFQGKLFCSADVFHQHPFVDICHIAVQGSGECFERADLFRFVREGVYGGNAEVVFPFAFVVAVVEGQPVQAQAVFGFFVLDVDLVIHKAVVFLEEPDVGDGFAGQGVRVSQPDRAGRRRDVVIRDETVDDTVVECFRGVEVVVAVDSVGDFHSVLSFRPGETGRRMDAMRSTLNDVELSKSMIWVTVPM